MPRGFVGKSVKKFFTNTEEALDRAGKAHNRNPFDTHRTNHSVPLPNLPPTTNQPAPFTPADAKFGGSHARGAGDSSNVVVDPDVLDNIARRMEMIDRQATDDMCRVADEIEVMCSTIFVVPETAARIRTLCDNFKRAMHQARYVTEDTAIDVRKFVNEISGIDHGNPGEIAMSRSGADQAIQRVSSSMDRQISNMERTANNYKAQSERLDDQAERERRRAEQLAASMAASSSSPAPYIPWSPRPAGGSSSDSSSSSSSSSSSESSEYSLEELKEQLEAVEKAIELEGQSEALIEEAERLKEAIEELIEAKEREIEEIERRIEEIEATDRQYAEKLRERKHDLQLKVRVLEDLREIINDSFPVTCASTTATNLALVAAAATFIGNSAAHISPGIQCAAGRLQEVAQQVVTTAIYIEPQLAGIPVFCALKGDPINMATGNFLYSKEDISIPGRYPLAFKRFYNAMGSFDGVLGQGWTHTYNIRMFQYEENIHIIFSDGHIETYTRLEENFYVAPLEHKNALTIATDEGYAFDLLLQDAIRYRFDSNGALRCIDDTNANKTILDYDSTGILLEKVTTQSGSLHFKYNDDGRLTNVSDHTGRDVSFEYSNNLLISAIQTDGGVFKYEYDNRNSLQKVTNPMGVDTVWNRYDQEGRTITQYLADDGVARLEYNDEQMVTIIEEQNKNKIEYHRDEQYRTTKIVYADDSCQSYDYDQQGNCIKYVDRNKNAYNYEYDLLGNITATTDPLGNKTTTVYNTHNKPTIIAQPNGAIITTEYDPYGNITAIIDSIGRQIGFVSDEHGKVKVMALPDASHNTLDYDERGNITTITSSQGMQTHYEYDALNRVVRTKNGEGATTAFEYNTKGDISKVIDALGNTRSYNYNLSGKVTKIIDFNGTTIEYKYNKIGKIEQVIDPVGGATKLTYDVMWNVTSITDPCGNVIRYEYDEYNRVVKSIDQEGHATSYMHDYNGNVIGVVSPLGLETMIFYDELNRPIRVIEPDKSATRVIYDDVGNITQMTDPLGNTIKREYDLANQLKKVIDPLGNETYITYTALGQVENVIDAKGNKHTYSYYPGGNRKSVTLPCGETETYEYDSNGNIKTVTDALGNTTTLIYDSLDRVVEATNALGHSKHFKYNATSEITHITDENGNTTEYKYSLLGDVVEVIDATGHSTKYSYDAMKRLTEIRQYNNLGEPQITSYERNKKGEVVAVTSPLGDIVKYTYDRVGNLVTKQDEDNFETLYSYNLVNKLSKISYADGKTVEFEYNTLKQLTEMRDWLGTTSIELDPLGRATKVTDHEGNEVGYAWNALGQREKLVYPDGKEVSYEYTPSGKLSRVLAGADVTTYTYDSLGRISERILPDDIITKYEFNPLGALASLTHSKGGSILDQFKYMHDPAGNITQIEKHRSGIDTDNGVFKYAYDPINRLIEVTNGVGISKQYGYDTLGNRISNLQNGVETRHCFNSRNQLIQTFENNSTIDYLYDKRGNLTQVTENGQLKAAYTFDATNMMVGAQNPAKGDATYTYNGFRNRVAKLECFHNIQTATPDPIKEVRYILDITLPYDNLLMTQGMHNQSFTWGNSLLSANTNEVTSTSCFYYLQDHLGSPIRLLSEGSHDNIMTHDEFGISEITNTQYNSHNPFGFTGYQTDDISGLYYAQARFYNPATGRFCAEDLIKGVVQMPLSINAYAYCLNSPLTFIDPDGLAPFTAEDGIEAHQKLQAFLEMIPGVYTEYSIFGAGAGGGFGFADVVYFHSGIVEVYEIKPITWRGNSAKMSQANAQLNRYIVGIMAQERITAIPGQTLNYGINNIQIPSTRHPGMIIKYYTCPIHPGIIFWSKSNRLSPDRTLVFDPLQLKEMENESSFSWSWVGAGLLAFAGLQYVASVVGIPFTFGGSTALKWPATATAAAGLALFFTSADVVDFFDIDNQGCV